MAHIDPCNCARAPTQPSGDFLDFTVDLYRIKLTELLDLTDDLSKYSLYGFSNCPSTPDVPLGGSAASTPPLSPLGLFSPRSPRVNYMVLPPQLLPVSEQLVDGLSESDSASGKHSEMPDDFKPSMVSNFSSLALGSAAVQNTFHASTSRVSAFAFESRAEWAASAALSQIDLAVQSVKTKLYSRSKTDNLRSDSTNGHPFVHSPSDPNRIAWDLFGILLISYDLLEIPLALSFEPPRTSMQVVVEWVIRIYWTLNIAVALTTGYISDGVLEMDIRKIARRYCKTWFIVDALTVVPDWLYLCLDAVSNDGLEGDGSGALIRTLRFLRLFRIARLMRMTKLRNLWHMVHDVVDSEQVGIVFKVVKNIMLLIVVNHYIACMWFTIGWAQEGNSWVKSHGFTDAESNWYRQFLASFHWSLTQLTPSSVDIYARSVSERLFSIGTIIFGFVGFSFLVGSITSSLGRLQALSERRASNFWILRKYLKRNKVPHGLSVRIRAYVESQWERQEELRASGSIESLTLLSENLKVELRWAIDGPAFCIHPLFNDMLSYLPISRRLLLHAVSHFHLAPQDVMFTAGVDATNMSFLTSGLMHYERMHSKVSHPQSVQANEQWIAEPVLWITKWCHLGDLRAKSAAELLQVHPDKLCLVARDNPLILAMFSSYAKEYVSWLSQFANEYLTDITHNNDARQDMSKVVRNISKTFDLKPGFAETMSGTGILARARKMF